MSFVAITKLLKNKRVSRALTLVIVAVVGYFFYQALKQNWQAVKGIDFRFNILSVLAILLFVYAVTETGRLWGIMLSQLSKKHAPSSEIMRVQIASWLLKYVPGQAGSVINKVSWGVKHGYSKKLILISFIYENVFLLLGSFILSVPLLLFQFGSERFTDHPVYLLVPIGFFVVSLAMLNSRIMHPIMNFLFTKTLKQPVDSSYFLTNTASIKLQLYYLWPRVINGLGFVLLAASFLTIDAKYYAALAAIYVLAGAIGILAIFVPSGIGVREAVIAVFAGQFMPVEQAIILAVIARLYATVADGALALLYAGSKVVATRRST